MKKILNIALATVVTFAMSGCQDFLDTSSPSVVDRDFVFSNEESARGALYYGYETLRANRSLHNVGFFWHPVWGSDIEDPRTSMTKVVPESVRNGFIPVVRALITSTPERVRKCSPRFTKQYPWQTL
ncbi:hypothetical protein [Bacteroides stercorirosoris]|uniref:hypothetical protein n=1 Tax=Bacteroides stercorirosoris TaxID=871324 RepID=UPI001FB13EF0|nr:hypothetical protein [Bacteroides stercorirosoris]